MSVSLLDLASFRIVSGASVFWPVLTRLSELILVINIRGVPHNDIHLSGDEHPVKSDRLVGFLCSNAQISSQGGLARLMSKCLQIYNLIPEDQKYPATLTSQD